MVSLSVMLRQGASVASRSFSVVATSLVSATSESGGYGRPSGRAGRALELYVRRAREHESLMKRERVEFERGKRHLANMMGLDPNAITQEDIDKAISYLFPSSLTDPKALPVMRPPDEILPKFNALSFDEEGRPVGSRFYTLKPNFYSLLSEICDRTEKVYSFHDERVGKKEHQNDLLQFATTGSSWLTEEKMAKKLGEKISTEMYAHLLMALDHLVSLPGSVTQSDFLSSLRSPITSGPGSVKLFGPGIPAVQIDPETKKRFAVASCRAKATKAEVRVTDSGKGRYVVDGQTLDTFISLQARETLLCPLIVTGELGKLDITASTSGFGGDSAVPRAVRHGVALCLAALRPDQADILRLAGLLTRDPRTKERNKVNQPGARAKWIWSVGLEVAKDGADELITDGFM